MNKLNASNKTIQKKDINKLKQLQQQYQIIKTIINKTQHLITKQIKYET